MKTLFIISGIITVSVILTACKPNQNSQITDIQNTTNDSQTVEDGISDREGQITISATDSGFNPQAAVVKSGDTITWMNNSSRRVQIGSNDHPTHKINQDITGGQFVIELEPGQNKTVTVTRAGNWGYHNHLKPAITGTITVE